MAKSNESLSCYVEATLRVIDGRWKVLVLQQLLTGTKRFGALHRALPGISHRTLTKQLRELEADGILRRKVYAEVPPRVDYTLTRLGETLRPVLAAMEKWGEAYAHRLPAEQD
ncbi:MAG TPA: helix-turn-helix domain-containing protein [Phycisphaerales bacterium]|nr:helix-turn-helix domain-containing protein [Phycisphaerales bacterium]